MTVIPDSIEPYVGWKALTLGTDSTLHSPSYDTCWPARKPLEATCHGGTHTYYRWTTTTTPPNTEVTADIYNPTVFAPPAFELPDGLYWTLEPGTAANVNEHCTCGIYAVDNPEDCSSYRHHPYSVLVEVALWGRLIRGSQGARGQYAYPQRIIIPEQLRDHAEQIHQTYGVPIIIATIPTDQPEEPPAKAKHKYLKPSFAQIMLLLNIAMLIMVMTSAYVLRPEGLLLILFAAPLVHLVIKVLKDWDRLT